MRIHLIFAALVTSATAFASSDSYHARHRDDMRQWLAMSGPADDTNTTDMSATGTDAEIDPESDDDADDRCKIKDPNGFCIDPESEDADDDRCITKAANGVCIEEEE